MNTGIPDRSIQGPAFSYKGGARGRASLLDSPSGARRSAVTIGNFDGLHRGHMRLIATLTERALNLGLPAYVYTFRDHPQNVILGAGAVKLLTDLEKKLEILSETGVDGVYAERFDRDFAALAPEDFVGRELVGKFGVRLVVVGRGFRFGRGGCGDVGTLAEYGRRYGFSVEAVSHADVPDAFPDCAGTAGAAGAAGVGGVSGERKIISSSLVRELISSGKIGEAALLLGRLYSVKGRVITGADGGADSGCGKGAAAGCGKSAAALINTFSVPGTACALIYPDIRMAAPASGLYEAYVRVGQSLRPCEALVGRNASAPWIRVRALDNTDDLHGAEIEIFFYNRIPDDGYKPFFKEGFN